MPVDRNHLVTDVVHLAQEALALGVELKCEYGPDVDAHSLAQRDRCLEAMRCGKDISQQPLDDIGTSPRRGSNALRPSCRLPNFRTRRSEDERIRPR
jgi:hypothetical protein